MAKGASNHVANQMGLWDVREIALRELANMPHKTSTAFHSKIVFGSLKNNKWIALILNVHLEGLQEFETWFLVNLLKEKGIHQIKFIIESSSTGKSEQYVPGNYAVISDYIDKGNFPAVIAYWEYFPFWTILWTLNTHLA